MNLLTNRSSARSDFCEWVLLCGIYFLTTLGTATRSSLCREHRLGTGYRMVVSKDLCPIQCWTVRTSVMPSCSQWSNASDGAALVVWSSRLISPTVLKRTAGG